MKKVFKIMVKKFKFMFKFKFVEQKYLLNKYIVLDES